MYERVSGHKGRVRRSVCWGVRMNLKVVVAVLQVGAEVGEQLDAAAGQVQGALLLQVGEAHALVRLSLERREKTSNIYTDSPFISESPEKSTTAVIYEISI